MATRKPKNTGNAAESPAPARNRRSGTARSGALHHPLLPWLGVALIVLLIDQLTKIVISKTFALGERMAVTSFFDLIRVYNKGAAFSMFADATGWQRWFFTAIGVVAALFILFLLTRHAGQRMFAIALSLILGGALGNVLDRLVHGQVVDFLLFYYGNWAFPAFNVADSAITVGAILLVLDELLRVQRAR